MRLLNHVGDVNLGIHHFAEFAPVVSRFQFIPETQSKDRVDRATARETGPIHRVVRWRSAGFREAAPSPQAALLASQYGSADKPPRLLNIGRESLDR